MPSQLTQSLKQYASELGFQLAGCCSADSPPGFPNFVTWLESGFAGKMDYMAKRREAYSHPQHVLAGVRSILMLGTHYSPQGANPTSREQQQQTLEAQASYGQVARYACGESDYHDVIWERLNRLGGHLSAIRPAASWRGVVDTAPLLEREFAQLAGLGWQGKNTLLIHPARGSYFFLAALLTDQVLEYDAPLTTNHCGTCTACLDACPTNALIAPQILDARRCLSYLTIELRDAIPAELRPLMGDWIFGCDVCQEVCPWNRFAPETDEEQWHPRSDIQQLDLEELLTLDEELFRLRFRRTPLWRPRRRGLLRNAAIALGNQRRPESIPALERALQDSEALIRGAAAWALGQFNEESARQILTSRLTVEQDPEVRREIQEQVNRGSCSISRSTSSSNSGSTQPDGF